VTPLALLVGLVGAVYGAAHDEPFLVVLAAALFLLGCWRGAATS
jgi:hypothetical protein